MGYSMALKRFRVEQIIPLLGEAEVALAKGPSVPTAYQQIGYQTNQTTAGGKITAG